MHPIDQQWIWYYKGQDPFFSRWVPLPPEENSLIASVIETVAKHVLGEDFVTYVKSKSVDPLFFEKVLYSSYRADFDSYRPQDVIPLVTVSKRFRSEKGEAFFDPRVTEEEVNIMARTLQKVYRLTYEFFSLLRHRGVPIARYCQGCIAKQEYKNHVLKRSYHDSTTLNSLLDEARTLLSEEVGRGNSNAAFELAGLYAFHEQNICPLKNPSLKHSEAYNQAVYYYSIAIEGGHPLAHKHFELQYPWESFTMNSKLVSLGEEPSVKKEAQDLFERWSVDHAPREVSSPPMDPSLSIPLDPATPSPDLMEGELLDKILNFVDPTFEEYFNLYFQDTPVE